MTSSNSNPNDVFWLARYAHNQTAPLFAQAKTIEPSLTVAIQMDFYDEEAVQDSHINIYSHWSRDGMFQYSVWLKTKADVDWFVAKLAADVAKLEAVVPA